MATVSFQLTSVTQETVTQTIGQPGAPSQAAADKDHHAPAPQDAVTISHGTPPEPLVPFLPGVHPVEPFPGVIHLAGNGDGKNSAAANNGTPAQPTPPTLPPKPPVDLDALQAPAFTVPALNLPGTGDTAANPGAANTQAQLTPQQELVQLDQTLQQLGVDPQSISLFNRMAMLLFAQDPTALKNLVDALQAADQQLGQLAGLANPIGANVQTQGQLQGQNAAVSGNSFDVVAAQLNFTEVQGTITTEAVTSNGDAGGAAQALQTTTQFQELQLSFTALEIQGTQAASNNHTAANAQGQALNVKV